MITEKLVEDLKKALETIKTKSSEIGQLQASIASIEAKLAEREVEHMSAGRRFELQEWDSEAQAKRFCDWAREKHLPGARQRVMDTTTNSGADGGDLVPEEFQATLLRLIDKFGFVRANATNFPMSTDTVKIPKLTSGVTVYWIAQNNAITPSQPAFDQITLTVSKLAALVGSSTEMIEDSSIAIANLISTLVSEKIAREEDRVGLIETATPYAGLLYASGTTGLTLSSGKVSYDDIDADDLLDMQTGSINQALEGGRYLMHRSVLDVVRKLKDKNGNYIWNAPANGAPGTIWGYPYDLHDLMPATTAASQADTPFIAFGNLRNMYFTDRRKLTAAMSEHKGFAEDQLWWRWTERVGYHFPQPTLFTILSTAAA